LKGEVETEDEEPKNLPSRSSSKQDEPAFRWSNNKPPCGGIHGKLPGGRL
jgi:hypothetical protein